MADTTQYVKKIDDYYLKDEQARNSINEINGRLEIHTDKINEQTTKINEHTSNISQLANGLNLVTQEIEEIKTNENITLAYNETTETITLGLKEE